MQTSNRHLPTTDRGELPNWRTEDHEKEAAINPGSSQCHLGISAASTSTCSPSSRWERWANCNRRSGQTVSELAKRCGGRSPKVFDENVLRIPVNHLFLILKFRICDDFVFFDEASWGVWALATAGIHDEHFFKKAKVRTESGGAFYFLHLFGVSLRWPRSCFTAIESTQSFSYLRLSCTVAENPGAIESSWCHEGFGFLQSEWQPVSSSIMPWHRGHWHFCWEGHTVSCGLAAWGTLLCNVAWAYAFATNLLGRHSEGVWLIAGVSGLMIMGCLNMKGNPERSLISSKRIIR